MVIVKVSYGHENRRIKFDDEEGYEALKRKVASLFPALREREEEIELGYCEHGNGDIISFSSDEELRTAISTLPTPSSGGEPTLRLLVRAVPPQQPMEEQPEHLVHYELHPFMGSFGDLFRHDDMEDVFGGLGGFGFGSTGLMDLGHWWEDRHRALKRREEALRRKREAEEKAYRQQMKAMVEEHKKEMERHRLAVEKARKEQAEAAMQQQQAQQASGSQAVKKTGAEEQREVTRQLPGGGVYHYHPFGHSEPVTYEGPFWKKTVIGPVGYRMSWGWPASSPAQKQDEKEEKTTAQEDSVPMEADDKAADAETKTE